MVLFIVLLVGIAFFGYVVPLIFVSSAAVSDFFDDFKRPKFSKRFAFVLAFVPIVNIMISSMLFSKMQRVI